MFPVFIGIFFLYYFIVILPEKRSRVADERLKSELTKNDRVVTIGGIHAVVAAVSDDSDIVTLKLDEGGSTRIKVDRSAIRRIIDPNEATNDKNDKSSNKNKNTEAKN